MDKIIALSTRLHCSATRAFEMFTVNERLETWLASQADVEAVVGGKYELTWEPAGRERSDGTGCTVTAVAHGKLLAFEWKGPGRFAPLMNSVDPLTHVTVCFIPSDELFTASTDVYLLHSGWRRGPDWQEARQWFARAWNDAFEELQRQASRFGETR